MQLQAAISEKALHFHMLHDKDGGRVHQEFVCEKDSAEVTRDHVIKGYQLAKGKYVEVEPEELKKFLPESTGRIDIADFVALAAIDPIHCAHTYSVQLAKGGDKAYALLGLAMEKSERVAIARVVIRNKQSLCALRPGERGLLLSTMHYADEVIAQPKIAEGKMNLQELLMAQQLIDALSGPFKPEAYKDDYRETILGLIKKKSKGKLDVAAAPDKESKHAKVIDLAEALQASLAKRKTAPKPAAKMPAKAHAKRESA